MKIEIAGATAELPVTARVNVTGVNGRRKRTVVMTYVISLVLCLLYIYVNVHHSVDMLCN